MKKLPVSQILVGDKFSFKGDDRNSPSTGTITAVKIRTFDIDNMFYCKHNGLIGAVLIRDGVEHLVVA